MSDIGGYFGLTHGYFLCYNVTSFLRADVEQGRYVASSLLMLSFKVTLV